MSGDWTHPLFNCFDDLGICLLAYFAPCVLFGQNNERMQEGSCVLCGIAFFIPVFNLIQWVNLRGKIREMNNIEGSMLGDCFTILLCGMCALAQESMEVRNIPGLMSMARE